MKTHLLFILILLITSVIFGEVQKTVQNDYLILRTEGISFTGDGVDLNKAKELSVKDALVQCFTEAYIHFKSDVDFSTLSDDELKTNLKKIMKFKIKKSSQGLVDKKFAIKSIVDVYFHIPTLKNTLIKKEEPKPQVTITQKEPEQPKEETVTEAKQDTIITEKIDKKEPEVKQEKPVEAQKEKVEEKPSIEPPTPKIEPEIVTPKQNDSYVKNTGLAREMVFRGKDYLDTNIGTAIEYFTKAIKIDSTLVSAYRNRAEAYLLSENHIKAIEDYTKALEFSDYTPSLYIGRGKVFKDMGLTNKAIEDFNQAIELDSVNTEAYFWLGRLYEEDKEFDRAIYYYNQVLTVYPEHTGAFRKLADLYLDTNNFEEAIKRYKETLALDSSHVKAYLYLGIAYAMKGKKELSSENFNQYLKNSKNRYGDTEKVRNWIIKNGHVPKY